MKIDRLKDIGGEPIEDSGFEDEVPEPAFSDEEPPQTEKPTA